MYARPMIYAIKNPPDFPKWSRFAWRSVYDLDSSFQFMLDLPKRVNPALETDESLFYSALAGFIDAEGHIGLRKAGDRTQIILQISNTNKGICHDFLRGIHLRGFECSLNSSTRPDGSTKWELTLSGKHALQLMGRLDLRHDEKIVAKHLAIENHANKWSEVQFVYRAFRGEIIRGRNEAVTAAKKEYANRNRMKEIKRELLLETARRARSLNNAGLLPGQIARALGRSPRTAYRHIAASDKNA
jgi:hypothetical protein